MICLRIIFGLKLQNNSIITFLIKPKRPMWFRHEAQKPVDSYMSRAYQLDFAIQGRETHHQRSGAPQSERTSTYHGENRAFKSL